MPIGISAFLVINLLLAGTSDEPASRPAATGPAGVAGFRGLWYERPGEPGDLDPPLRGGMATFAPHPGPVAAYSSKASKTFFVYGGAADGKDAGMQVAVSFYDHQSGRVARPVILASRNPADPRGNPALTIDSAGHLWIFAPGAGKQAGEIYKSRLASDIQQFDRIARFPLASAQPWHIPGKGFLVIGTRMLDEKHEVCFTTSADGQAWSEPQSLARIGAGCDAVSWSHAEKVGVAIAHHPRGGGPAAGVCYLETRDAGKTWTSIQQEALKLPLKDPANPATVFDYGPVGQLIWLKDLNMDATGAPTLMYLISRGGAAGPTGGPFTWVTARWVPRGWRISGAIESDNVGDSGVLCMEKRSEWRVVAPTGGGAEPGQPGGEVMLWQTEDFGRAWARTELTHGSDLNHNYIQIGRAHV